LIKKGRPKGEGSVYRRKDGRVVGEYDDLNGRTGYITSKIMTKAQMKAKVRKQIGGKAPVEHPGGSKPSLILTHGR
jgi:hypothetical protein